MNPVTAIVIFLIVILIILGFIIWAWFFPDYPKTDNSWRTRTGR
ncbi:MAG: hypothetical protein JG777_3177 [Clostridia bacterium]|jgi:regulatory protein YycH of two-component signal transduction system YycFG|nr:hypothetical protein [Clostridia bacterium]